MKIVFSRSTLYHSVLYLSFCIGGIEICAQSFQDVTPVPVMATYWELEQSAIAWGDYDVDGDLDFIATGINSNGDTVSVIYEMDGNIIPLADSTAFDSLVQVFDGSVDWGDFDNDGDPDLLISGQQSPNIPVCKVYENNGSADFDEIADLPGVAEGAVAWGDYDQDGRLDIVITGRSLSGLPTGLVYHNDGNGTFSQSGIGIPQVYRSSVKWSDFDLDGDLDLALSGRQASGNLLTTVLRNDGGQQFIQTTFSLPGLEDGTVDWGDYDNDGDPDLLLTGRNQIGMPQTLIYENDNGSFLQVPGNWLHVSNSCASWGDYTDDGFLDFFVSGTNAAGMTEMRIYQNDTSGGFVEDIASSQVFPGVAKGSIVWGDFSNDSKLDLLVTGIMPTMPTFNLYANTNLVLTTDPSPPTNLQALTAGDTVWLSWDPPMGTPPLTGNGYTYKVFVGSAPGISDIVSPHANLATGVRQLVRPGNASHRLNYPLTQLDSGTYYWSVQVVNQRFQGSEFASESNFYFAPLTPPGLVFPGDANHDQVANHIDLLPIGLHFGKNGPLRPGASLNWIGQTAPDWGDTLSNGKDLKHVDTDGSGQINSDDTLAIVLNYHQTHTSNKSAASNGVPLRFSGMPTVLNPGDTLRLEVHLGNADTLATDLYGLAFSIEYDTSLVAPSSLHVQIDSSWLGIKDQDMLSLYYDTFDAGRTDIAMVRTDQQQRSGYGKIADVIIVMDDDIAKREIPLILSFANIIGIDAFATEIEITGKTGTSILETTAREPRHKVQFSLYPNPVKSGETLILESAQIPIIAWELLDLSGRMIFTEPFDVPFRLVSVSIPDLNPGIYLVRLQTTHGAFSYRLAINP